MPSLEVRRCGDGHPPVTERERDIRLNGTGGVKFCVARIEKSVRAFSLSGSKSRTLQRSTSNAAIGASFFIERWTLCVNRWTFSFDESAARSRRRSFVRRRIVWRDRHACRRDLFQYRDDRLSGSADRPVVSRPDRGDDLSINRKLRHELTRSGKPLATRA